VLGVESLRETFAFVIVSPIVSDLLSSSHRCAMIRGCLGFSIQRRFVPTSAERSHATCRLMIRTKNRGYAPGIRAETVKTVAPANESCLKDDPIRFVNVSLA
jgi:hypothetical protein